MAEGSIGTEEAAPAGADGPGDADRTDGWELALGWTQAAAAEQARIAERRRQLGDRGSTAHHIGLALSGGGIRSATFSVGILRSLSRLRLMHRIDYLSTVSGGGYAGAFYCRLFVPTE